MRQIGAKLFRNRLGYVESVRSAQLHGWVLDRDTPQEFRLSFEGTSYHPSFKRVERADVQASIEDAPLMSGFVLDIPEQLLNGDAPRDLSTIAVYFGKRKLPILPAAIEGLQSVAAGAETGNVVTSSKQEGLYIALEASIVGMLQQSDCIELVSKAEKYIARLAPLVAQVEGIDESARIEVPATLWAELARNERLVLKLIADGEFVTQILISRDELTRALAQQGQSVETPQMETLLALEHVREISRRYKLAPEVASWARDAAGRHNIVEYVTEYFKTDTVKAFHGTVEQSDSAKHAAALRAAWARFEKQGGPSAAVLDQVIVDYKLNGALAEELLKSLAPYFCQKRCFEEISHRIDEETLMKWRAQQDAWHVSLTLPFLAIRGRVGELIDEMRRLDELQGWLNTECVLESSRLIAEGVASGEAQREFIYGFKDFVQNMSGSYWTRLYDRSLAEAAAVWLKQLNYLPDWLARDASKMMLSVFGLSRDFWSFYESSQEILHRAVALELKNAHCAFNVIETLRLGDCSEPDVVKLLNAAKHFRGKGNADADKLIHEICQHIIIRFPDDATLMSTAEAELRALSLDAYAKLFFHPAYKDKVDPADADGFAEYLASEISGSSRANYSPRASVMLWLAKRIGELKGVEDVSPADCAQLIKVAKTLGNQVCGWLSADVLFSAANAIPKTSAAYFHIKTEAEAELSRILATCETVEYYPAIASAAAKKKAGKTEASGVTGKSPLFGDTLLIIYSCNKYLEDRIPKLRDSWLKDLDAKGIPYLIMVGDGDNSVDGDLLRLDVSDTYEDLPDKTLKMIEWVYRNADYQYVIKVDDDCALNVDRFFDTLAYRKHHYRGRILSKGVGGIARDWHQQKSHTLLAQTSLDRSPEPSTYCDGGSAYSLSRHAMRSLIASANTTFGRWLQSVSYMEDKLVGDLLAKKGIKPSEEGYYVHILRRTHAGAKPLTMYANYMLGSKASPVSVVHLDEAETLAEHYNISKGSTLGPARIWPVTQKMKFGWNSHALEYIGSQSGLDKVTQGTHVVVSVLRNEMTMLPHFLEHYRRLGVDAFLIADNLSDDGTREYLLEQNDVALYSVDSEYKSSHFGVDWQQTLLSHHCLGKWALVVDADEFLTFENVAETGLRGLTKELSEQGYDAALSHLIDMYPKGLLADCDFKKGAPFDLAPYHDKTPVVAAPGSGYFSNSGNSVASALRHRLSPDSSPTLFTGVKVPLIRYSPLLRLSEGIHFVGNVKLSPQPLFLAHFKYHSLFAEKVENEIKRKQHYGGGVEYQKYLTMLAEARGVLFDKDVSVQVADTYRC
ncbi:glycosyltransferase family 2 protein [Thioclava sp. GXIMD4216]|uniref:glycosyltransferase family 2 protein n=1 Tax=Thioclava sp. GXIMD4216 TaxID=3131929 RepID=UPI0030CC344B